MGVRELLMVALAACSGCSVVGCRQSAAVPPPASLSPAITPVPDLTRTTPQPANQLRPLPVSQPDNPWKPQVAAREWKHIVIHHTASTRGSVESIHETHLQRKDKNGNPWLGIGYHFVIGNGDGMGDGEIEETFRWRQQMHGAHAGSSDYNDYGIGIALVGNFDESPPSAAQLQAVKRLVGVLKREYNIASEDVIGHADIKATACPGKYFPMSEVSLASPGTSFGQNSSPDASLRLIAKEGNRP